MIVCCTFDTTILGPTFQVYDDLVVEVEGIDAGKRAPLRLVFWAEGVPTDDLDTALAEDPTVADVNRLATADDATLYRTIHPEDLPEIAIYNAAIEQDALVLAATNSGNGWEVRFRIPDRESLVALCDLCRDLDVAVDVATIREGDEMTRYGFGLTQCQRDMLGLAWERGYFSIPRETSLSELAAELDISQQAASERLRRGLWVLVSNTVCECDAAADCERA